MRIQVEYDRNWILRSKCDFDVTQCGNLIGGNQYLPVGALYTYGDANQQCVPGYSSGVGAGQQVVAVHQQAAARQHAHSVPLPTLLYQEDVSLPVQAPRRRVPSVTSAGTTPDVLEIF